MRNLSLYAAGGFALLSLTLGIGLLATRDTLSDTRIERDDARASLRVSNSTITTLQGELKKTLDDQVALANGDANRISASRQAVELADAANAARQVMIDRLRVSAGLQRPQEAACQVSDAVMEVWP